MLARGFGPRFPRQFIPGRVAETLHVKILWLCINYNKQKNFSSCMCQSDQMPHRLWPESWMARSPQSRPVGHHFYLVTAKMCLNCCQKKKKKTTDNNFSIFMQDFIKHLFNLHASAESNIEHYKALLPETYLKNKQHLVFQ